MTTPGQRPMMGPVLTPRRVLFFRRGGQITCPDGHRIPDAQFQVGDVIAQRCHYRYPTGRGTSNAGECGKLILIFALGGPLAVRGQDGQPVHVIAGAEITSRERTALAEHGPKSPEEILSFLGILL